MPNLKLNIVLTYILVHFSHFYDLHSFNLYIGSLFSFLHLHSFNLYIGSLFSFLRFT